MNLSPLEGIEIARAERVLTLAYYPKPEHAAAFASSLAHLKPNGPADDFPGSVGTLKALIGEENGERRIQVVNLQGSFRERKTPELKKARLGWTYPNWRAHLLEPVFKIAAKEKLPVALSKTIFGGKKNVEAFLQAARKNGFKRPLFGRREQDEREEVRVVRKSRLRLAVENFFSSH